MITRREWAWAAAMAAVLMAFTAVPYLLAAARQGAAWRFSGALLAVEDGNSYIADMRQGAAGAWLFTLPYTSEPHRPVMFFGLYLLLGKLAGTNHGALVMVFHAARIVGGFGLLLASYRFLAEFLPAVAQRRLGLVLVALGGGLGWLLTLLPAPLYGSLPVDLISPEAFSFLVLFGLPHLAVSRALLLLGFVAYLRNKGLLAGLAWLGVGLLQPLYVAAAWLIIAADIVAGYLCDRTGSAAVLAVTLSPSHLVTLSRDTKGRVSAGAQAVLLSAPMLVYTIAAFTTDPILSQWNAQNRLPSPHPLHYLLAYGVWLVPAVVGWRVLRRSNARLAQFAAAWLLLAPALLYLPIPTQRRLIEGVQLPLVALAVLGLTALAGRQRWWALAGMAVLVLPTSLLLWVGALAAASRPAEPIFLPAGQAAVFEWLANEAQHGEVALAAYDTGNALPAYTPLAAYIGHGPETIGLSDKVQRVARFYSVSTPDAERRQLLAEGRIRYVLVGPHERALGEFDPASAGYLQLIYREGGYAVHAVVP